MQSHLVNLQWDFDDEANHLLLHDSEFLIPVGDSEGDSDGDIDLIDGQMND